MKREPIEFTLAPGKPAASCRNIGFDALNSPGMCQSGVALKIQTIHDQETAPEMFLKFGETIHEALTINHY